MKPTLILGWAYAAEDGLTPPEERLAEYQKYLKNNRKRLYPLALKHMPLLQRIFEAKLIPYKEIEPLMEQAGDDTAIKAALLEYMNQNFDVGKEREKIEKREAKVFDHVLETGQLPPAELNRLWSVKKGKTGEVGIASYNGEAPARLEVPAVLRKVKVTAIESCAFSGCKTLTEIVLPKGLKKIGSSAFRSCSALEKIVLPRGLKKIESDAFADCTSLTEIILPDSVKELEWNVFQNCTGLTDVVLPKKLEWLNSNVFSGCTALKSVKLPEGVWSIGNYAFAGCTSLTGMVIPESVGDLEQDAFLD